MEINQYDITKATHYDITMVNDVAWNVNCEIIFSVFLQTHEISLHKHNPCVHPRLIKHSLVLVIGDHVKCLCLRIFHQSEGRVKYPIQKQ